MLAGVDRLYLLTGHTIAMITQSKTLVDAARKAGVSHIVNHGVFAEWDCTDPHLEVESWYAKGAVDWCVQVADGRMGYIGTVRDEIAHLLGRPATTLREWVRENRERLQPEAG